MVTPGPIFLDSMQAIFSAYNEFQLMYQALSKQEFWGAFAFCLVWLIPRLFASCGQYRLDLAKAEIDLAKADAIRTEAKLLEAKQAQKSRDLANR